MKDKTTRKQRRTSDKANRKLDELLLLYWKASDKYKGAYDCLEMQSVFARLDFQWRQYAKKNLGTFYDKFAVDVSDGIKRVEKYIENERLKTEGGSVRPEDVKEDTEREEPKAEVRPEDHPG